VSGLTKKTPLLDANLDQVADVAALLSDGVNSATPADVKDAVDKRHGGHVIADVTGLQGALDGKEAAGTAAAQLAAHNADAGAHPGAYDPAGTGAAQAAGAVAAHNSNANAHPSLPVWRTLLTHAQVASTGNGTITRYPTGTTTDGTLANSPAYWTDVNEEILSWRVTAMNGANLTAVRKMVFTLLINGVAVDGSAITVDSAGIQKKTVNFGAPVALAAGAELQVAVAITTDSGVVVSINAPRYEVMKRATTG